MISRPGFLYAPPILGHSQFAPLGGKLGQAPPAAAAPQTIVIQAPAPAVAVPPAQESGGVALIGVIAVVGAIMVALEVGGVIDVFGLDKLQQKFQQKQKPSKNAEKV